MFAALILSLAPCQTPAKEPLPGRAMIDAYFARQVKQIADNCLNDLTTKEDWERRRPELRRQFLEMMGLWPLPERTDLKATITGTSEGEGYTVEKLHFQSKPGLYVTANVYTPNPKPTGKIPAILYVCGHGNIVENGISYGSKAYYQYHPAWFAKHGYVCIILDTLQLGEIKGEHHGTYKLNQWWWQSRGYTPGGVELWNAMRAIDYLETRTDVDAKKIGVTGRSGGGATSWWVAAADDRPAAIAPIAGIADLESHICKGFMERLKAGVIAGHCDCMFMVNTYRWDFAQVAALAAPRPLLLGNSDADDIFPVPGYRSIAAKVGKVYDLYGKREYFDLLETKGPHKDTPELRIGINRFMNKWLKGDTTTKVEDDLPPKLPATALKVLKETPKDAINERIAETFVPRATWNPANKLATFAEASEWNEQTVQFANNWIRQSFSGWEKQFSPMNVKERDPITVGGVTYHRYEFESEPGIGIQLITVVPETGEIKRIVLEVLDDQSWNEWLGPLDFSSQWTVAGMNALRKPSARFVKHVEEVRKSGVAFAVILPRGVGPTRWADPGTTDDTHIRRRFALLGQTLEGQQVWDVRRAIHLLTSMPKYQGKELTLSGREKQAPIAAAAAFLEPSVKGLTVDRMPKDFESGAQFLNTEKVIPTPRHIILLMPKPVTVIVADERDQKEWDPIVEFAKRVGRPVPTFQIAK
jgi:dienelactone hydrolase